MTQDNILIINRHTPAELLKEISASAPEGMIVNINKPYTWTSADVVRKLKFRLQRHWQIKKLKVGHAGTLDPLATGVLLVCVGKATKHSELYQAQTKEYIADIRFGATTPSFDLEHDIDCNYPWEHISRQSLENALASFLGPQEQMPPVYSAKYTEGMRAYEMVRQGMDLPELKPAKIEIFELELLDFQPPVATLRIVCSKGTYVRALARDLGFALESGAHLIRLERSKSGEFCIEDAWELENFENLFQKRNF